MGLTTTDWRMMIRLHKEVGLEGPVLCLGNQDIYATHDDLRSYFKKIDCSFREVESVNTTSAAFLRMGAPFNTYVHAKTFFAMMGIDDYWDVDKYDYDKPMLLHDLNDPIPSSFCNRFRLVVDGGTSEHIFNVKQVLENMVRSLQVGGWVWHNVPSLSTMNVNHGFYGFSPCLFYDFYAANGFTDFRCFLVQHKLKFVWECKPGSFKTIPSDIAPLDLSRGLGMLFAARKSRSLDVCRIPMQNDYYGHVESGTSEAYVPIFERYVPKPLRPVLKPLVPFVTRVYNRFLRPKPRRPKPRKIWL